MLTKLNNNPFYDVALGGDMATVLALFLYWKSMLQTTAVPAPDPKCSIICKKQQWNPVVPSPDPLWPMVASKILSINVMNRTSEKCTCTGNRSDLLLAMWIKLLLWSYRNQAALSRGPLTPSSSHRMPWRTWLNTISMSIKCGWANHQAPCGDSRSSLMFHNHDENCSVSPKLKVQLLNYWFLPSTGLMDFSREAKESIPW